MLGASLSAANGPVRETQLGAELRNQGGALMELEDAVRSIEDRLSGVIRPMASTPETPHPKEEELVPTAGMARANRYQIEAITRKVRDILSRLEV